MNYQFEGKHERVFYLDNYFDSRNLFIREIRDKYNKYINGDD